LDAGWCGSSSRVGPSLSPDLDTELLVIPYIAESRVRSGSLIRGLSQVLVQ
uniref:Uncharacterized protein n=1 Tax=Cannabis sativa TaxID=3483 RepID=A0A803QRV0_CANSA